LTSSEQTYRKSRKYAIVAGLFATASVVALGVLFIQIDALEKEYGTIRSDIGRFTADRDAALSRRDSLLEDINQKTVDEQSLRESISALNAEKGRLISEIAQQKEAQKQDTDRALELGLQAKAARETIAEAEKAREALEGRRERLETLDKEVGEAEAKLQQFSRSIDEAVSKERDTRRALATAEREHKAMLDLVKQLQGQVADLNSLKQEVAELEMQQKALSGQSTALSKEITAKQATISNLSSQIPALDSQSAKAQNRLNALSQDLSEQDGNRSSLLKEVQELEKQKASGTGTLASLQAAAASARQSASDAAGLLKAAEESLSQAKSEIVPLKSQLLELQSERASLVAQVDAARAEVARLEALKAEGKTTADAISQLNGQKSSLGDSIRTLSEQQARLRSDISNDQATLDSMRAQISELNGRKGALAQQMADLNQARAAEPAAADQPEQPAAQGNQ
jgi:chromosome segregation ATPase